jgi:AcrR family transcriptional regulator
MNVSERAAARSVVARQARASGEVRALVDAGLAVMQARGAAGLTVAEVLAEAGLSTRAFYRYFSSKDELVLAVFEHEAERRHADLQVRLATAASPRSAIEMWVDEMLALGFEPRRARRTKVLAAEGGRAQADFPVEFAAIVGGAVQPLEDVLASVPRAEPERDAWSIYAVTWELVQQKLRGSDITLAEARAHVLRFCLPALGMRP